MHFPANLAIHSFSGANLNWSMMEPAWRANPVGHHVAPMLASCAACSAHGPSSPRAVLTAHGARMGCMLPMVPVASTECTLPTACKLHLVAQTPPPCASCNAGSSLCAKSSAYPVLAPCAMCSVSPRASACCTWHASCTQHHKYCTGD